MPHSTQPGLDLLLSSARNDDSSDSPPSSPGSKSSQESALTRDTSPHATPPRRSKNDGHILVEEVQSLALEGLEQVLANLSAGALPALSHYKKLYSEETAAPTYVVKLTFAEYLELQEALARLPSLKAFVRSKPISQWSPPDAFCQRGTLLIRMPETRLHGLFGQGVCDHILKLLRQIMDNTREESETHMHAERVYQLSTVLAIETTTMQSEAGGEHSAASFIAYPDAAFSYAHPEDDDRDEPYTVIEVALSQDATEPDKKAMKYARIDQASETLSAIITFKLPYKGSASATIDGPLPDEGICKVVRPVWTDGKLTINIDSVVFMNRDRVPKTGKSLKLYLSDFCPPGYCSKEDDRSISISSGELVMIYNKAVACQKRYADKISKRRVKEQEFGSIPYPKKTKTDMGKGTGHESSEIDMNDEASNTSIVSGIAGARSDTPDVERC